MKVEVTRPIGSLDRLLEGNKAGKLPEVGARLAGLLETHLDQGDGGNTFTLRLGVLKGQSMVV